LGVLITQVYHKSRSKKRNIYIHTRARARALGTTALDKHAAV